MRLLILLPLLLAIDATAQPEPSHQSGPALTPDQEAALVGIPVLATAGTVALWARNEAIGFALVLPIAPAAAVCAVGSAGAFGGDCLHAFGATLRWSAPGLALIGLGAMQDGWDGLGFVALGGIWLIAVPPFAAAEGYRRSMEAVAVTPAVVSDPATHRLVPGVQVRIGL